MKIEFKNIPDTATFRWLGKPNPYTKDTGPWWRTEFVRKMSSNKKKPITIADFVKAAPGRPVFVQDPRSTLRTLLRERLIEIEGHEGPKESPKQLARC